MKLLLTFLLSVFCLPLWAATGDIIGALVETNGEFIEIFVENKGIPASGNYTNGTGGFAWGFTTNNSGLGNVWLSRIGVGYDTAGGATTPASIISVTKQLRLPFPFHTNNDITARGSDAVIRCALGKTIYASDNTLRITVAANWWSNNNAVVSLITTNDSTLVWPKPAANWTCVPKQQISGSTFRLSVISAHGSAEFQSLGKPVNAVRFRSVSATAGVTNWATLTKTRSDLVSNNLGGTNELWVSEWVYDVPTSGFTQGQLITNNFDVYPYMGDSILSSDDGVYNLPPGYCPITMFCDKNNNFSTNIALVASWGSDTAGRVTNVSVLNYDISLALATLDGASKQLAATNLLKGHGDTDGGIIYVMATNTLTSFAFAGASGSYGTNGLKTWLVVTNYPTNVLGDIVLGTQSGNQRLTAQGGALKICGMYFTNTPAALIFGQGDLWVDQCAINAATTQLFAQATNTYVTRSWVTNMTQGLFSAGGVCNFVLIRDNIMTGFSRKIFPHVMVGNYKGGKTTPASAPFNFNSGVAGTINSTNPIIAYNFLGGVVSGSGDFLQYPVALPANSITILNNVFETPSGGAGASVSIANDSSVTNQHNVINWNNTEMGERSSMGYNDLGSVAMYRHSWSILNNLVANYNTKHDTFSGNSRDGARVGGFPVLFGVNWSGNASPQLTNVGGSGSFEHEFIGLNSFQPPTTAPAGIPTGAANASPSNYVAFVFDGSRSGAQTGNGDYRVLSRSPILYYIKTSWVLPFDLQGVPRGGYDVPGAYATASPRKGDFIGL